ncbi:GEVED domain-containing protein, partial [Flavobacterium sp. SUN046]|uniref:GEVED domain-containing protein n=1 Tax=Flavobacterium sp. SUN046 TaxID=3002440 RepID=UPI002DB961DB
MRTINKFQKFILLVGIIFTFNSSYSQNNACNIRKLYDQLQSGFHSTIATLPDDSFLTWGNLTGANGTSHNLTPVVLNTANGYSFTGVPLFASLGTNSANTAQFFLMSSTGLYAWGTEGACIPSAMTSSTAFQSINMPTGVTPSQVVDMKASFNSLALVTTTGEVWVCSKVVELYGVGATAPTATTNYWAKVTTSATGNPVLTGVTQLAITPRAMMAYTSSGTWYTWGSIAYIGNGVAAAAAMNRATPMTAPFSGAPKVIAMTSDTTDPSYFALNPTNNKIYAMGNNTSGQLGRNNTTDQKGWVFVQNAAGTADLTNVIFISANDQDNSGFGAVGCITSDKHLYIWGSNNGPGMVGQASSNDVLLPSTPNGFTFGTDIPLYLEVGGHTSAYLKECADRYCYTGHKINGSMGDGVQTGSFINVFDCANTPQAVICGASSFDTGDAPFSFDGTNPAAHYYKCPPGILLGSVGPTANNGNFVNVASGADNMGSNGDGLEEDGISSLSVYNGGGTYSISVKAANTSGAAGFIYAWIDWNENGVFEASEYKSIGITNQAGSQTLTITWTSISNTVTCGKKYLRLRITNAALVDDTTTTAIDERSRKGAIGGEVEDYVVNAFPINAGPDQILTCAPISSCSATMNATGPGTWTADASNPGTAVITNSSSATTTITNFSTYGTYIFTYTNGLCSDSVSIIVTAIDAVNDTPTVVNSATSTTVASIYANDTLNGVAFLPANITVTTSTLPTGFTLNSNGTITVAAGTASGTYPITYTICQVANPSVCDTAVTTIIIGAIDAVNDASSVINGTTGGVTPTVFTNDTVNGASFLPSAVIATPVTMPSGLTLNANGTITVAAGTAPGTYPVVYQICQVANSTICDTASSSVVVTTIDAVNDTPTVVNGTTGATVASVFANDTLNGVSFVPANVILTSTTLPTGFTLNSNGTITVAAGTAAGSYPITYTICQVANPTICDTAVTTIVVATIDAVNDTPTPINGTPGGTTASVLANDTLNGSALTPSAATLTPVTVPSGLTLNANGTITVAPGTASGTYPVVYQICQVAYPSICDTASSSVVVTTIDAVNDTPTVVNGTTGATVASVFANDTLNGVSFVPANVILTSTTLPTGFTLNSNGTITVAAGTAAGSYPITYTICQVANPTICDTAVTTIVVATIDAVNDTPTPINGTPGGTTASVLANDTLNGSALTPSAATLTPVTVPSGLTLNANGTITVAPGTASGTYPVVYQICQVAYPSICDTASSSVVVTTIDAVNDTPTVVNGATGATVATVFSNDTLNGVSFISADVVLTSTTLPTGFTLNSNGTITVAAGTAAGSYPITYTICQVANPTICDTAVTTIVVATIDAINDTPTPINGTPGGTTASVLANDTLNGSTLTPSAATLTPVTVPSGLTLNANGTITVAPGTASGTYPVVYQICQVAYPSICDIATSSVVVTTIDAVNDTPTVVNGATGATVATVFSNDTLNGVSFISTDVVLTSTTLPTGFTLNSNGTITVAAGTAAGSYPITYTICQVANPTICDTAVTTVVVATIDAINDTSATIPSALGGTTASVLLNDTLNGSLLSASAISLTSIIVPTGLTLNPDGTITVAPGTAAGSYAVVYQICQVANPSFCDTATATVEVAAIDAVNDTPSPVASGSVIPSVLLNDTLNGAPIHSSAITLTPNTVPSGLNLNPDGTISIDSNTPSGTYLVTYTICEIAVPSNCDTATATVVVLNPIDAVVDTFPTQAPSTTVATTVGEVTVNDTLNGISVTTTNTDVTPVTNGPLSIDANGILTLAPNTTSGTYTITYQLCEVGANPSNCDTATATVVVLNPIDAIDDTTYPTQTPSTTAPTTVGDVTANDTLNGVPVTTANTDVTPVTNGPLSIDANGILTLAPNTTSGTYTITYQLCETGANPSNCDTATATVVVLSPIDAVVDTFPTQTPSTSTATTVGDVTANDTLNGVPVTTANTDVTPVTNGPLSIDANGILTLAPNATSGTYTITYQICEAGANPSNCDTATATVVVLNPIDAVVDTFPTQTPSTSTATTVGDVTANDTLNGIPVTTTNTDVTPVTNGPLSIDANGILTLAPNTTSGTYTITYQLCEAGVNPSNCDTATATVVVLNPIDAVVDTFPTQVPSTTVVTTVGDVTVNDTLNGVPVTTANTDVTPITTGPLIIDANGILTLAPNATSGTYTITYQICEVGANPSNCDTATATVVVLNPIDAIDDNTYPTQVPSTTVATTVGDVTINDTLNGVAVTSTNTDVTPITTGPLSIDANGILTLAPNATSGTYTITYQICEAGANPSNCDTATATVVVLNPIDAIDDNTYPTQVPSTTSSTTVGDVTANDTLNGIPVTIINTDVTPVTNGPLSIDANGILTLAPNATSGTYTITYQICEAGANPSNCDTATATVVVLNPIDAIDDNTYPTQVPSTTVATTVGDVTANDTLNGVPVTTANTDVTPITNGPLSIDANGILTLAPNTTSGTYTITYQICEAGANPSNCVTATATVVVLNPIDAIDDNTYPTQVPSTTVATTVGDVTINDTLNGVAVTTANTDVTPITNGPLSIDGNGILTLAPNTTSGTYTITYQICEAGANPSNCDTATATVVVASPIDAIDDTYPTQVPSTTVATTVGDVTVNDTLNGVPVTTANTDVTPVTNGPLSIDANGILTLAPNTTSGTYTITYQICEVGANPSNCDTATATVVVLNPIDAVVDTFPTQTPSTSTPLIIGDVTVNDTLNGVVVTTANTDVTPVINGPLSIDANGILTLAPNTTSGTYTITYQICEAGANPSSCDTATATVVVLNPIDAIDDNTYPTQVPSTTVATTVGDVTVNDTLNGVVVTTTNTDVTPVTNGPLSIDANGILTLAPKTTSGTYTITYQLCETGANPSNCDTATATVVVLNPIDAIDDNTYPTQVPSTTVATTVGDVTVNDTLNGVPITTANTDVTPITTGPLSIDANGILTLAPNTTSGTYTITYQLCETGANPSNCDTATATVVVLNPIDAVDDNTYPTQVPSTTAPTTVGDVTANDTLNGVVVTTINTDVTPITTGPLSIDANGILTLAPNTTSGTYTITYQLCETGANPSNCDTATATVVVLNPIDAIDDNTYPTQVPSTTVATTVGDVTVNDTLNGVVVTTTNTDVTPVTNGPLSIDANGILTLAPNTTSGTYTITYQLCETGANPSNCDTATATVVVLNPIDAVVDTFPTQTPSTSTATTVGDVTVNDTLNGVVVTTANTDVTPITNGPLSIDANGILTLAPNTTSGTYTITYQLCEVGANPANCDTATANVVVLNPIDAIDDTTFSTQVPSTTVATTVGDVTVNDTLNGVPVTTANTDVTPITTGPLSIDANGILTLAPNATSGTYTITYQICEVGANPSNCDTATATVVVLSPIDAIDDNTYPTQVPSTTVATTVGDVTVNDTLNGVVVTTTNTDVTPVTNGPLSIDANGILTLAPNTTSGTYTITYQLCEAGANPSNCDTATATVVVLNPIDAVVDTFPTQTPSTTVATTVGDVTVNDTLNGVPVTTANTDVTPITTGPLSIDANGILTLAPNATSGTYTITYQICEVGANPSNCDTA